jgi:hypothetical protein
MRSSTRAAASSSRHQRATSETAAGGDAAISLRRGDAVAELDRVVLAEADEDDSSHLVRLSVRHDQRRPETILVLPTARECVETVDRLLMAAGCRDRDPDRLGDIGVIAIANERLDVPVVRTADDHLPVAERLSGCSQDRRDQAAIGVSASTRSASRR